MSYNTWDFWLSLGEEVVGDVDGDAFLTFGGEAIAEEREVDFQSRQLILEEDLGFELQAVPGE